jgi:putative addiction module component (TIGR02574 family)
MMMSIEEIRNGAMELPQDERALLAASLLASLPAVLDDNDDGVSEARRRSLDLDENPTSGVTWDEISKGVRSR